MTDVDLKSFTSRKLSIQNALMKDGRLSPVEYRVATVLLSHANADTGLIFPSQELIAVEIGKSRRTVIRAIEALVDKGWLAKERANKHLTNKYEFLADLIGAVEDNHIQVKEALAEQRQLRRELTKRAIEADVTPSAEVTSVSPRKPSGGDIRVTSEVSKMAPEHLKVTPTDLGIEVEAITEALVLATEVTAPASIPQPSDGHGEGLAQIATQSAGKQALPAPANDSKPRTMHDEIAEGRVYEPQWPLRGQGGMNGRAYVDPTPILDRIEAEMRGRRR